MVAGCTGGTTGPDGEGDTDDVNEPAGGDGSDEGGSDPVGSCDDIRGTPRAFDPGDRQFPLLFEYPDTFEEYNSRLNESSGSIGAQFGHADSAESASYPVNLSIHQHKNETTDEEAADNWVTTFGTSERIDWTFDYGGRSIDVYGDTASGEPSTSPWKFLLPVHESDGVRGVTVRFEDGRSESACHDAITASAQALVESLTVNPGWRQQDSA